MQNAGERIRPHKEEHQPQRHEHNHRERTHNGQELSPPLTRPIERKLRSIALLLNRILLVRGRRLFLAPTKDSAPPWSSQRRRSLSHRRSPSCLRALARLRRLARRRHGIGSAPKTREARYSSTVPSSQPTCPLRRGFQEKIHPRSPVQGSRFLPLHRAKWALPQQCLQRPLRIKKRPILSLKNLRYIIYLHFY